MAVLIEQPHTSPRWCMLIVNALRFGLKFNNLFALVDINSRITYSILNALNFRKRMTP
jgi:hypothetical protein